MKLTYKIIAVAFVLCLAARAQSPADKVYLTNYSPVADVDVLALDATKPILSGWVKTSNVGAILAGLSMECSIWTNTSTQVISNTGKSWSTARAAVEVDVMVDGKPAMPGKVVYCDRSAGRGPEARHCVHFDRQHRRPGRLRGDRHAGARPVPEDQERQPLQLLPAEQRGRHRAPRCTRSTCS